MDQSERWTLLKRQLSYGTGFPSQVFAVFLSIGVRLEQSGTSIYRL